MNIQPDTKHDSVGNDDGSHGGEDFVLTGNSAWLRIGDYSLFVWHNEDKINVGLYALGDEATNSLAEFNLEKDSAEVTSLKIDPWVLKKT